MKNTEESVLDYTILSNNIESYCSYKGINIGDFEIKIGISAGYISRCLHSSKKRLSIDVVYKIAKEIGVNIDSLLFKELYSVEKICVSKMIWKGEVNNEN